MFAGTSTGEILTLALAACLTPREVRDLYVANGKLIFDASWARDVVEVGGLTGSKYVRYSSSRCRASRYCDRRIMVTFIVENGRPWFWMVPPPLHTLPSE